MNNQAKQIYHWVMREKLTAQRLGNEFRTEATTSGLTPKKQQECIRKGEYQSTRFEILEELMRQIEVQQVPEERTFNPEYY